MALKHVRLSDVLPPVLACASSLPEWLTNSTGIPTPELTQCATKLTVGNQITLVAIEQHDGFGSIPAVAAASHVPLWRVGYPPIPDSVAATVRISGQCHKPL